jgi:hypothetical protein
MKTYGGVEVYLPHYLPLHYVEASDQFYGPVALPPVEQPRLPVG